MKKDTEGGYVFSAREKECLLMILHGDMNGSYVTGLQIQELTHELAIQLCLDLGRKRVVKP